MTTGQCPNRWRGGRFACTSLIRRWSLEELTVARYADVNIDSNVSSISMAINNGPSRNSYQYNSFHPKVDSNPIASRVRRTRQRLPPNLLS